MKVIRSSSVTIIVVLLIGSTFAFADVKWGMEGGVTTGYDSNIFYSNTDRVGDMITHTSLDGGLTQEGKNDTLDIKTGVTENIYTDHSSLDNLAENFYADYKTDLNPFEHLTASDTFTHSLDPSSLQNAFGRINGTYGTYDNNLDLESKTDITEQWSASAKYMETNYEFTGSSLSSSGEYNPELSTEYDFSSQSQATFNYDYRKHIFTPGGSSEANTPSAGWRQYLDPQWYVDLLAGADFIKGFGESLDEPRFAAGLTHDVDQNTQLTLKFDKQYETDAYTQDIFNDWHIVLNGFHQFTPRLSGDIALFTGQGKYVVTRIKDKFIGTNIAATYAVNKYMDFTLTYSLNDSVSNSDIRANVSSTILAGVTFKF